MHQWVLLPGRLHLASSGPAELDIPNIGLRSGLKRRRCVEPVAERVEECAVQARSRILPDCHIITIASCSDAAVGRDVGDKVPPEPHEVILVIAAASSLDGKTNLFGAGVGGERRINEGVAGVPDLHLLD